MKIKIVLASIQLGFAAVYFGYHPLLSALYSAHAIVELAEIFSIIRKG